MDGNLCEPILSICIPTYSRCKKLYADITKWLKSENKKFEIVVSDNCSNDGTQEKLASIKDDRLVFLQNHANMGTSYNSKKAMLNGRGKYLMQLMDKDFVNLEYIDEIINYLEKNDFAVGRLAVDSSLKNIEDFRFNSKIKALCEFCFTGNHPSGFLFNREILHKYDILEKCHAWEEKTRAFYTDFISTLLLRYGDAVYIDIACVYTVKPPFEGVKHSYTYSESKGNLFFTPLYKFQVFEEYISFLQKEYKIPYSSLFKFIKRALVDFLCYSNAAYLSILNNKEICDWYNVSEEFIEKEKSKDQVKYCFSLIKNSKLLFRTKGAYLIGIFLLYFWYLSKGRKVLKR